MTDHSPPSNPIRTLVPLLMLCAGVPAALILVASQISIFVIQPIGALPEGKTLIISRMTNTKFIDSADAICERTQGGVSLICRIGAMGGTLKNAKIYMRLPYMEWLYLASTGGKTYSQ